MAQLVLAGNEQIFGDKNALGQNSHDVLLSRKDSYPVLSAGYLLNLLLEVSAAAQEGRTEGLMLLGAAELIEDHILDEEVQFLLCLLRNKH
jgi:hypothetical protein